MRTSDMRTSEMRDRDLAYRLRRAGLAVNFEDARTLRRAELTLQRWAEHECNGDIQRDEKTGVAYWHYGRGTNGPFHTVKVADRERGALQRVAKVCAAIGAHFYHQGDPRGCALYVSKDPLTGANYTNGVACCD